MPVLLFRHLRSLLVGSALWNRKLSAVCCSSSGWRSSQPHTVALVKCDGPIRRAGITQVGDTNEISKKKEEKEKNLSGWRHRRSAASRPGSAPVEGTSRTLLCNSNVVVYPRQLMSRAHRRRHRTQHEDPALSLSRLYLMENRRTPKSIFFPL